MASYRFYCLDGAGGIGFADWIEADNDDAAIVEVKRLRPNAHKCELWQSARLVATLNAQGVLERVSDESVGCRR